MAYDRGFAVGGTTFRSPLVDCSAKNCSVKKVTSALYERLSSRGECDFAGKPLSAMRYQFGGHLEKSNGRSKVA
jgi:6-phosphogluconate dehydrogenase (decarboxylating)